jgi:hypothetical protein
MDPVFFILTILWIVLFGMEVARVRAAIMLQAEEMKIRMLIEDLLNEMRERRDKS